MTPEDILHTEFPERAMEYLHNSFDGLPYATHALWGLSYWLKDKGDQMGSRMVAAWAEEFSEHEANRANAAAARGGSARVPTRAAAPPPSRSAPSLNLRTCSLEEFADAVLEAAQGATTGRWHGAVFISGVWDELTQQGDPGISLDGFRRRLIQAYQADLLDLSRADLVEAMPPAMVRDSEASLGTARFHFVRLDDRAAARRPARATGGTVPLDSDSIFQAALKLGGGRGRRVLLRDLRPLLQGSKEQQDEAILQLQDEGDIVLYREDSPDRHGLDSSAIYVNGQPRHILIVR